VSRPPSTLEKHVVARIMKALKGKPGVVVRKRHGTVMGVAGDPDLYGTIRGRHFEIEVKRPNDPTSQPTELQTRRLVEWRHAGAITGVARSVGDALAILGLGRTEGPEKTVWVCADCRGYRWPSADAPARCPGCGRTRFEREVAA
jgi:hypothetical protein